MRKNPKQLNVIIMNLSRIKNLVKQNGDKVILVENDEPEVVVMSFAEYEKLMAREAPHASGYRAEPRDGVRVEEAAFHETEFIPHFPENFSSTADTAGESAGFVRPSAAAIAVSDAFVHPEEIRLEDLPL